MECNHEALGPTMSDIFAEIKMVLTLQVAMWPDRSTTYC